MYVCVYMIFIALCSFNMEIDSQLLINSVVALDQNIQILVPHIWYMCRPTMHIDMDMVLLCVHIYRCINILALFMQSSSSLLIFSYI